MAIREKRRDVHPGLKIEIVELVDEFGASHLIQQPLAPVLDFSVHDYENEGRAGNVISDWHEAQIEDVAREMLRRETAFCEFAKRRGHDVTKLRKNSGGKIVLEDPLADYKGCCNG
jgi:hypothetical protein